MKKLNWLIVLVALITLAACGSSSGGGGGGTAEEQAEASMDDFGDLMGDCLDSEVNPCECPGGGTMAIDETTGTMTALNCVSSAGKTYSGVIASSDGGETLDGTLAPFGDCSTATASGVGTDTCEGTFDVVCPAGSLSCDVIDDPDGEGECDLEC